jgi:hypothetical protein
MKRLFTALAVALLLACTGFAQVSVAPVMLPKPQFFTRTGAPCSACTVSTYTGGTTSPLATYTDSTGRVTNPTTITLDSAGYPPDQMWLGPYTYKLVLKDSLSTVIWTVDNVTSQSLTTAGLASLSASNVFTAPQYFKNLEGIRYADQFSTIALADADCGSDKCIVIIPSTYTGTDCPAYSSTITHWDFRGTANCTYNVLNFNYKTPGLTNSQLRFEMTRTSVDAAGSIVSFYPITHLNNATVTGGVVDGDAPEAQVNGTLSGTLGTLTGSEQAATVTSTGGTVTTAMGAIGYVYSTVGSTTAITNAYGLWGRGCLGTISGAAPTNCYGGFFSRQLGAASGRNYSIGIEGRGLLLYDANVGVSGLDCEDASGVARSCFYIASDNSTNYQAVNVFGGYLRDSTGASQLSWTASGVEVYTALLPRTAGTVPIGSSAKPFSATNVGTANGALWVNGSSSELITLSTSGTTTDSSANLLPAGALIQSVACRVTTTITTATDWSVGDGTTAARFSSANATLVSGTTSIGLNQMKGAVTTDAAGPTQAAAAKLRITTTGTPGAGAIRCTVFYSQFTAPTS